MERRKFIQSGVATAALAIPAITVANKLPAEKKSKTANQLNNAPLAITMWEFSWLERRWDGAGYENWGKALDELIERGYNAVRIDAFPHLFFEDATKEYMLLPCWNTQLWGSPSIVKVKIQPAFQEFLLACAKRNIRVGLSSWFREDEGNVRMKLDTPEKLAGAWMAVLDAANNAGVLNTIVYVDLCNEWTGPQWCPYFVNDPPSATWRGWHTQKSRDWMSTSIKILQSKYPQIPYTFSFTGEVTEDTALKADLSMLDFLELHIWMTSGNKGEFYKKVNYNYERFSDEGYKNLQLFAEKTYREKPDYWKDLLVKQIQYAANWSAKASIPLATTECWGIVDYKDWPMLSWDWVKELCALGVEEACKTGAWLMVASSNFCGPQFIGMWRDVTWHQRITSIIRNSQVRDDLKGSTLWKRICL